MSVETEEQDKFVAGLLLELRNEPSPPRQPQKLNVAPLSRASKPAAFFKWYRQVARHLDNMGLGDFRRLNDEPMTVEQRELDQVLFEVVCTTCSASFRAEIEAQCSSGFKALQYVKSQFLQESTAFFYDYLSPRIFTKDRALADVAREVGTVVAILKDFGLAMDPMLSIMGCIVVGALHRRETQSLMGRLRHNKNHGFIDVQQLALHSRDAKAAPDKLQPTTVVAPVILECVFCKTLGHTEDKCYHKRSHLRANRTDAQMSIRKRGNTTYKVKKATRLNHNQAEYHSPRR